MESSKQSLAAGSSLILHFTFNVGSVINAQGPKNYLME
jgi:hypothetical protein